MIGAHLRALREASGFKAAEVGRVMGVSRNAVWKIECDEGRRLSVEEVSAYLQAVGASDADRLRILRLAVASEASGGTSDAA